LQSGNIGLILFRSEGGYWRHPIFLELKETKKILVAASSFLRDVGQEIEKSGGILFYWRVFSLLILNPAVFARA